MAKLVLKMAPLLDFTEYEPCNIVNISDKNAPRNDEVTTTSVNFDSFTHK